MNEENSFALLKREIRRDRGLDCDRYKDGFLKRRVAVRLRATGAGDYREYIRVLRDSPEEYSMLFDELCIGVTGFFRDRDVFEKIRENVVPEIISRKEGTGSYAISAWSAGCATGEEAYSVALLFLEAMGDLRGEWKLSVIGTDIDKDALDTAKKGIYETEAAEALGEYIKYFQSAEINERNFLKAGEALKEVTRFRWMDLGEFDPVMKYDLILCRNVLIYFCREVQVDIICRLEASLRNGGYLILGKTETLLGKDCRLEPVFARERIYRLPL